MPIPSTPDTADPLEVEPGDLDSDGQDIDYYLDQTDSYQNKYTLPLLRAYPVADYLDEAPEIR